ncbi:portal protein [Mycobacterium phage DS6A]|uniref:Portal protein n=1 Tax=Mycobacterium phage DS6A TaxID=45764 RepID=G8I4B6_9CAUD|nr:portal protein [Mycobacterium phage DS6A]AER47560.1 portal protein [Mycobacterium phage DS6A]
MIERGDIPSLVSRMWRLHLTDTMKFDNIHGYVKGERGLPSVPDDADDEVKEIRRISTHNVLTLVLDAFVQNLSVVGYRSAQDADNAAAWALWQANQMDARQAELYSSAVKYGVGYCVVEPGDNGPVFRPRSPRQLLATYEDPHVDRWPQYALETWIDTTDAKPRRRGILFDDRMAWPLDLGPVVPTKAAEDDGQAKRAVFSVGGRGIGKPVEHGAVLDGQPVCPVVRYTNRRDAEDLVDGELERLLKDQRAINEAAFDRMIVSRFGAFPQTVLARWGSMPDDAREVLKASMRRVWAFDEDVQATRLPAASLEPYNALIEELQIHVAMRAQVSPAYITGRMVNLSADALAAAEANMHRKLSAMRESHGESHEQLLRLGAAMAGEPIDPGESAEVIWRDTEARSFGAIVDGLYKLGDALQKGFPIEPLLPLVPGVTQQQIAQLKALAEKQRRLQEQASIADLIGNIRAGAAQAEGEDPRVAEIAGRRGPVGAPNGGPAALAAASQRNGG